MPTDSLVDQNAIEGLKCQRADRKNGEKIFPAKFALAIAIAIAIAVAFIAIAALIRRCHTSPLLRRRGWGRFPTKPTLAIAITIALAVTLRVPAITPLIHHHYLALFAMPIKVGDEFVDFKAFKAAMTDWSITGEHKFTFRYQQSDKTRNIVVCVHADCSFREPEQRWEWWYHQCGEEELDSLSSCCMRRSTRGKLGISLG